MQKISIEWCILQAIIWSNEKWPQEICIYLLYLRFLPFWSETLSQEHVWGLRNISGNKKVHCSFKGPKFNSSQCQLAYHDSSRGSDTHVCSPQSTTSMHTWPHTGTDLYTQVKIKLIFFKIIFYYWLYW